MQSLVPGAADQDVALIENLLAAATYVVVPDPSTTADPYAGADVINQQFRTDLAMRVFNAINASQRTNPDASEMFPLGESQTAVTGGDIGSIP